ncbi:MAG: hypothetical protein KTR16_14550 [Acidiferrobacterales bacterium]|nr:hypothetical protein [Acidiferrobacterales bacterium]
MNSEQLCSLIEEAFDGIERPEDITLHVAVAHDNYDYERDALHRKKDHVGRWQDVPHSQLRDCSDGLAHLDKYGLRYYLPAFMIWYVQKHQSDEVQTDNILYTLDDNPKDDLLSKYHKERFSLFTKKQLNACAKFIKFCANGNDDFADAYFASKKYERFWKQHEEI